MLPFPVLLADIGGTYARLAVLPEAAACPGPIWKVPTGDFPGPAAAIRAFLGRQDGPRPRSAFLAVAGRVDGGITRLTNAPWRFGLSEIGVTSGLEAVRLVNDYVPLAAALTVLGVDDPADVARIGPAANATGPRLVLGPGTGLGAAALIPAGDRLLIQTTEAGHVGFGPSERDALPWQALMQAEGRITAETLLSGPGLLRLARAIAAARGVPTGWRSPPDVLDGARTDPLAREVVRQFARLLGRFTGDLALVFSATGGVFLAGGIAPRIVETLQDGAFGDAFEDKPPFRETMQAIPRFVITRPEPAIHGLAALLRAGDRFLFPGQDWRA
ncbi:glucokinase [Methylobacterium sp. UNC378MF]|uniref:glucokinase n=1 Tax=Methylobacterium sp. UNC378MF TaxID=1502748 RepID=UPI00088E8444|nr:glucokinase [Methylobacterium sp. UNC378MF]SDA28940.1 glucokinase [Methylobacterium sp. UNC378MF]